MIKNDFIVELFQPIIDKLGLEETIIDSIFILGVLLIYCYVIHNFIKARYRKDKKKKEVKSVVETLSMSVFFCIVSIVVNLKIGVYNFHNLYLNIVFIIIYLIGTITNLLGRYYLGNNWGNNVVIYTDHTLVTNGVYKIIRHPLYGSIMIMIYAIGIIKSNYMVILLNTFIFIPFMYYRAKQEEKELRITFKEYDDYAKKTGMFFPNIIKMLKKRR